MGSVRSCSICRYADMRAWKGSFSIEAALIMPLVLAVFGMAVMSAISLHNETVELTEQIVAEKRWNAVEMMYDLELLDGILEEMSGAK